MEDLELEKKALLKKHIEFEFMLNGRAIKELKIIERIIDNYDLNLICTLFSSLASIKATNLSEVGNTVLSEYIHYALEELHLAGEPEDFMYITNVIHGFPLTEIDCDNLSDWIPLPNSRTVWMHRRCNPLKKYLRPAGFSYGLTAVRTATPDSLFKAWLMGLAEVQIKPEMFPFIPSLTKIYYHLDGVVSNPLDADKGLADLRVKALIAEKEQHLATLGAIDKKYRFALDKIYPQYVEVANPSDYDTYCVADIIEGIVMLYGENTAFTSSDLHDISRTDNDAVIDFFDAVVEWEDKHA